MSPKMLSPDAIKIVNLGPIRFSLLINENNRYYMFCMGTVSIFWTNNKYLRWVNRVKYALN